MPVHAFVPYLAEHRDRGTTYVYLHDVRCAEGRQFDDYVRIGSFYKRCDAVDIVLAVLDRLKGRR